MKKYRIFAIIFLFILALPGVLAACTPPASGIWKINATTGDVVCDGQDLNLPSGLNVTNGYSFTLTNSNLTINQSVGPTATIYISPTGKFIGNTAIIKSSTGSAFNSYNYGNLTCSICNFTFTRVYNYNWESFTNVTSNQNIYFKSPSNDSLENCSFLTTEFSNDYNEIKNSLITTPSVSGTPILNFTSPTSTITNNFGTDGWPKIYGFVDMPTTVTIYTGNVTREYPVLIINSTGSPVQDVNVSIRENSTDAIIDSELTGADGYTYVSVSMNTTNYQTGKFLIRAGGNSTFIGLATDTPITLTFVPLEINVISPLNQSYNTSIIDFNVSLNQDGDWCGFSLDEAENVSMTQFNSTYYNYTYTLSNESSYNITFSCNNTEGTNAISDLLYFSYNTIPIVNITSPINETVFYANTTYSEIDFEFTASSEFLDSCWYSNGTTNTTLTCGTNISLFFEEGAHTIYYYANDTSGDIASASVTFTIIYNICVDIDHPDYGTNYLCGYPNLNFLFNISYFRKTEFNDSTIFKNFSYNGPENKTFYINANYYDELISASIDLEGFEYNGTSPHFVRVYVNNSLSNYIGDLGSTTEVAIFNDSSSSKNFTFTESPQTEIFYVKFPKSVEVIDSTVSINVTTPKYFGEGSDGDLIFNSSTQTFGNMVYGTDYTNTSTTVYLILNRAYQFSNLVIGSGKILSTQNTTGAVLYIMVNGSTQIDGTVTLNNILQSGNFSSSFNYSTSTEVIDEITVPGVVAGGNGGAGGAANTVSGGAGGTASTCYGAGGGGGGAKVVGYSSQTSNSGGGAGGSSANGTTPVGGIQRSKFWNCDGSGSGSSYPGNGYAGTFGGGGSGGLAYALLNGVTGNYYEILSGWGASGFSTIGMYAYCNYYGCPTGCMTAGAWAAGGGGGSSGTCGKSGINFYLKSDNINITGTINTAGTNGGAGGNGGAGTGAQVGGYTYYEGDGGGGGGAGGGNSGDVKMYWNSSFLSTGTITKTGGTGGSGGTGATSGSSGSNGAAGSFTNSSISIDMTTASTFKLELEIGIIDGVKEWNYNSTQNKSQTISFTSQLNTYLDSCTADDEGFCDIPMYFSSYNNESTIEVYGLSIGYAQGTSTVTLNFDLINRFLNSSTGFKNIPITIENQRNGTIYVDNLSFDYKGGNDTIKIITHDLAYTTNETMNITVYYSDYEYDFPTYVSYLEFIPKSPTAKNVTPYGQTNTKPILNFTTTNYGGNMNLSFYLNETHECVNLTVSTTFNKTAGYLLNDSWRDLFTNREYLNTTNKLWMWADYSCNYTTWNLWQPDLKIRGCCVGCICSEDLI